MKQKKIGKKFILNKKTIAALDYHQLKAADGGGSTPVNCHIQCPNPTLYPVSCPPTLDPTIEIVCCM